ncbi:MAG: hypothetical protein AABX66_01685 [Nanoarchaeota archaeon]
MSRLEDINDFARAGMNIAIAGICITGLFAFSMGNDIYQEFKKGFYKITRTRFREWNDQLGDRSDWYTHGITRKSLD